MKTQLINGDCTVNETTRTYPQTIPVFNTFGIDSCCGGGVAISIAAARDGADLTMLLDSLNREVSVTDVTPPACAI